MNKSELLEGLSIEELQERNEFSAVFADSNPTDPISTDPLKCKVCQC